ncbi:hypothetical protein H5410_004719 [Solanum commersonii]|uniref:Uncharacterized protein n=1 Tax=Solanum commersonii TaxID=4109 RepID=A0A9J6A4M1_SOLCO|nr:hypothetical protein H5410_004719 [Solanum commersonii]
MKGTGRGKIERGGVKSGRGNSRGCESFGTTSQPQLQPIRVTEISLEAEQSSNPNQGSLQIGQISSHPLPRTSLETQSSRNLEESTLPSTEVETGTVSRVNRKRGRGKYKSKTIDIKTKYGGKIKVIIPYDIDRAVGSGLEILLITLDGNWQKIILKHGEAMWYKVKVVSERNRKNREKQITKHSCGTRSFAEVEESTGQLLQLVVKQQSEEIEHRMTRDDILSSVLGERSGYVRGKGYGKKPPKKTQIQQADIESSVSSAMKSMRQEMQADMDRKLQEE